MRPSGRRIGPFRIMPRRVWNEVVMEKTQTTTQRTVRWPAVAAVLVVPVLGFVLVFAAIEQTRMQAIASAWVNDALNEMDRGFRSLHAALSQRTPGR